LVQKMTSIEQADEWMREMRRGNWESAWRISDRIRAARRCLEPRDPLTGRWLPRHLQWLWNGSPFAGKRVLVCCYHGLGDTIQFARFLPLLKRSAARVTVAGQSQLLPLLETVEGIDALLELDDGPCAADRDVDIEIMELAHALRTTLLTLPAAIPYIHVKSKPRSSPSRPRPRVGLVWQSGSWDPNRSVAPELMENLTEIEAIHFTLLQRGPGLATWRAAGAEIPVIHDILGEAAELSSLDLLISVDTLSAHLAGALAVPTWLLLPAQADWRWMEGREDTPWYPTMRLFRQSRAGDWESVLSRVAGELRRTLRQ
jgi:hypothetical protein